MASYSLGHATTTRAISPLSLHDALPISPQTAWRKRALSRPSSAIQPRNEAESRSGYIGSRLPRSEEHTSELQSLTNLVCRLLLEKKNTREKEGDKNGSVYNV